MWSTIKGFNREDSARGSPRAGHRRGDLWLCALALTISLPLLSAAATTGISPLIATMEFSVGPAQLGVPSGLPTGLPGSYVSAEQFGPFWPGPPPGAPDSADDDVYRADITLPTPLPFSNGKIIDDGFPPLGVVGTGLVSPPPPVPPPFPPPPGTAPPPPSCTIPTDQENIDALAIESLTVDLPSSAELARTALLGGVYFVQFSVDNAALGLSGTGVNAEANAAPPEHPGDVYESSPTTPTGTNVVIADEDAAGLALPGPPQDDLDALVLQQSLFDFFPLFSEDTDGVGGADTPIFFFSTDKGFAGTGGPILPSDLIAPGPAGGNQPQILVPAPALGLSPNDNLDALFVDNSGDVLFSLDQNSPSLSPAALAIVNLPLGGFGADPGDLIFVTPSLAPPPVPAVVITANEIGLRGTLTADPASDELNALWVTDAPLEDPLEIPAELTEFLTD